MKSGNDNLANIKKLLRDELQPLKVDMQEVKGDLASIKDTLETHTKSLADIENRIIPLAETVGAVVVDHSKRLGGIEGKVDDLEPRVSAVESVVSK